MTGEGILTSLKMMEEMLARKVSMTKLAEEELVIYPQVFVNVKVKDKAAAQADLDVQSAVEKAADELGDAGICRENSCEGIGYRPVVRVMVEAESEEACWKYVDQVVDLIKVKGYKESFLQ